MKRVLRHASVLLLLALLCCLVPRAAWAADVSDNCDKPKNIEVNKVYTGAFEKQGDRDCYRFKSGGGKFKLVVWFIPGEADSYDSRIDLMYGTYGTWSAIAGEAPEYMFGSEGIMSHWITGPLSYETAGVDYVLDGSYVRKTIDLGTFKKGKEAGIVLDGGYKGAYKFKVVGKKYVVRKSIKKAKVTVASPTYSGLALKPKVTVKLGKKTLKSGTDYSLTFSKNINAGSNAVVKVTGKGDYKDSISKKFTIKRRPLSNSVQITLKATSFVYSGKPKKPSFSIYLPAANASGMVTMQNKVDYTYKYENNVQPGTAKLVVTGKGNFMGTTTRTFTIEKLKQPAALKSTGTTVTYEKIGKTVSVGVTGKKEFAPISYSTSNAKVATVSNKGVVTFKGGGTADITVKLGATKHYKAKKLTYKVVVLKQQKIATSVKSGAKITCTSKKVPLGAKLNPGNGKLTYKSSDTSVVKVDSSGNLYFSGINKVGVATITITAARTSTYAKATKEISITTVKGKPVLTAQSPQEHNRDDAPFPLGVTASEPVELTYTSEKNLVKVDKDGLVTIINPDAITEDVTEKIYVQSKATGIYGASDKAVIELKISVFNYWKTVNEFINQEPWNNGHHWGAIAPQLATDININDSSGCHAYATDFVRYVYGGYNARSGSHFTNVSEIRTGDVIYTRTFNPTDNKVYEHWFVVLERNGDNIWSAEGNATDLGNHFGDGDNSPRVWITNRYTLSGNSANFAFYEGYHYDTGGATTRAAAGVSVEANKISKYN